MNRLPRNQKKMSIINRVWGISAIIFIVLGVVLAFDWKILLFPISEAHKYGPHIEIACDVSNNELSVGASTFSDGKTELSFVYSGEVPTADFWINIVDDYATFSWEICADAENVLLEMRNDHTGIITPSTAVSGEGQSVAFHLHFTKGDLSTPRVILRPKNSKHIIKEGEKIWFRTPCIYPWEASKSSILRFNGIDKPNVTEDQVPLYQPKLKICVSLDNIAYTHPGYVLDYVSPESSMDGYLICWYNLTELFPFVGYADLTWEAAFNRNGTLAGFAFGFGLSLIETLRQHLKKRR